MAISLENQYKCYFQITTILFLLIELLDEFPGKQWLALKTFQYNNIILRGVQPQNSDAALCNPYEVYATLFLLGSYVHFYKNLGQLPLL